jgi:hypothetical protein
MAERSLQLDIRLAVVVFATNAPALFSSLTFLDPAITQLKHFHDRSIEDPKF